MKRINTYSNYLYSRWSVWNNYVPNHFGFQTFRVFPGPTTAGADRIRDLLRRHHEKN